MPTTNTPLDRWARCALPTLRFSGVIASAAKQSISPRVRTIDCFADIAPRNDEKDLHAILKQQMRFRVLAADCARGLLCSSPSKQREQGMPGARCTRGLVCKVAQRKAHTSIQVQRRHSGIPCAMALRLMPCSPRRRIRLVTVAAGLMAISIRLGRFRHRTAWHQQRVSGPHGFAVRNQRRSSCAPLLAHRSTRPATTLRADAAASTASHPAFVTIAIRPSCRDGTGRAGRTDLPDETGQERLFSWLERSRAG